MVEITETDDSKVNSHHRYTGAVRVDFPRGEDTVDVDEETARTAVNSYETVEFADELVEQHESTTGGQAGKKAETRAHQNAAGGDTNAGAETRESRAPHATDADDANESEREEPGHEAP